MSSEGKGMSELSRMHEGQHVWEGLLRPEQLFLFLAARYEDWRELPMECLTLRDAAVSGDMLKRSSGA
ncbi:hypothetical protein V6N11_059534 [Hibiscus sabdariffa]|uniref:Uncharacterized protein n=1 Tax=Hibiscus sabdariffa TaxID=183260 RepID=A0ABR2NP10_9ROSI